MAVDLSTYVWWNDSGTPPGAGLAKYVVAEQPIAEWDNWFNYKVVDAMQAVIDDVINKFNANTILKADTDNTPAALSVTEQTIVGRKTGSSIAALTAAEVRTILNVENGATTDQTGAEIKSAYEAEANAYTDTKNTKLSGIDYGADVTADNPPMSHTQSASTITSGTLAVARGGTGVSSSSSVADVNSTKVDGCDAGVNTNDVLKVPNAASYAVMYYGGALGPVTVLESGVDGYQLTTHASSSAPTWSAASDLIFSDTHCPKCGQEFQDGDDLILHVIEHNEMGDILTLPMHLSCANEPKKRVSIKRKAMEEVYILDECTGDMTPRRVQKMQEKTLSKHVLKSGYVIDKKNGKVYAQGDDGNPRGKECNISDTIDVIEEVVMEGMYEDTEFEL